MKRSTLFFGSMCSMLGLMIGGCATEDQNTASRSSSASATGATYYSDEPAARDMNMKHDMNMKDKTYASTSWKHDGSDPDDTNTETVFSDYPLSFDDRHDDAYERDSSATVRRETRDRYIATTDTTTDSAVTRSGEAADDDRYTADRDATATTEQTWRTSADDRDVAYRSDDSMDREIVQESRDTQELTGAPAPIADVPEQEPYPFGTLEREFAQEYDNSADLAWDEEARRSDVTARTDSDTNDIMATNEPERVAPARRETGRVSSTATGEPVFGTRGDMDDDATTIRRDTTTTTTTEIEREPMTVDRDAKAADEEDTNTASKFSEYPLKFEERNLEENTGEEPEGDLHRLHEADADDEEVDARLYSDEPATIERSTRIESDDRYTATDSEVGVNAELQHDPTQEGDKGEGFETDRPLPRGLEMDDQDQPIDSTYRTQEPTRAGAPMDANAVIADWPQESKMAAQEMIGKYGQPHAVTEHAIAWHDAGPWAGIVVFAEPTDHQFPMAHKDVLEQCVHYKVPADKADELTAYDGSVTFSRTEGKLAAKCDKEAMNHLALNLAHDIIEGRRSVEDARAFYAQTAMDFKNGKTSEYTQGLMFDPMDEQQAADPDQPFRGGDMQGMAQPNAMDDEKAAQQPVETTYATQEPAPAGAMDAKATIANWPRTSKMAAEAMIAKYGQPDAVTDRMIAWKDASPWAGIKVSSEPTQHLFPMPHEDVLEQCVYYEVPADKADEIVAYDGSVTINRTEGTLSARCDKEEMNMLALNLAHDIATGKRSVEDARAFYAQTAMDFKNGKTSDYTQKLLFQPANEEQAGDPDRPWKKP